MLGGTLISEGSTLGGATAILALLSVAATAGVGYFVLYPLLWYLWDPLDLWRFPAPNLLAATTPLWLMKVNAGQKRSYVVHEEHKKHGDVLRVGPNTLYFNDPQAVLDIYGHKAISAIAKDTFYDRLAGDFHDIVQERNRAEHSRKRKYLANAFALATVVGMEAVIHANLQNLLDRLDAFIARSAAAAEEEETSPDPAVAKFNIRQWLNYFTLDVIGDMAFGLPMGFVPAGCDTKPAQRLQGGKGADTYEVPSTTHALHQGVRYSITLGQVASFRLNRALKSLARCSSYLYRRSGAQAADDFENIAVHQLQRRLATGPPARASGDFVGKILADRDGTERGLPLGELVAEATVLLNAGSDTTAAALTNTVYFLLRNPAALARLRDELERNVPTDHARTNPRLVYGDKDVRDPSPTIVAYEHVRSLPYLRACIDESLRLRPPITYPLPRLVYAPEGATVAGRHLRQGTVVAVSPYTIHRHPGLYKNPDAYDPGRWFDPDQATHLKTYNIPFSTGSRACIGRHIAIVELQILVSTLMLHYDLRLDDNQELEVFERFNANPGPLPVYAKHRTRVPLANADATEAVA
ncbi:Cytochrome P450 [Niveomyces insectorum RCEF 264]|uniref:Cytochrome P450 n=1 Tax=Niveomyces insectorum RCEF 264 TaxID=1081102 RepID=A0A167RXY8_9HYPO|nr:Cytochrome P450 [Niveomyces insectorum RCEF 264]